MGDRRRGALIVIATLVVLLWITGSVRARPPADEPIDRDQVSGGSVVSSLLQYQGWLTDPSTGDPVTDGVYSMSFRLYDVESGGSPLWMEIKDVSVESGLFSTALGDTTPLDLGLFDGQALWLGIKVDADAEATPRQQVLPVAYALSLVPGAVISGTSSVPVLQVNNMGTGDALHVGGAVTVNGDLAVGGSLTGGSHAHGGADITSGMVDEAYIDDSIARDAEATNIVNTHASNASAHHVRYTDSEAWAAVLASDGAGSGLDADLLDGKHASQLVPVVAFAGGDQSLALSDVDTTVRFVTLVAPTTGYVIVTASGYARFQGTDNDGIRCSITTGTVVDYSYLIIASDGYVTQTTEIYQAFASTRGYYVSSSGTYTFRLVCNKFPISGVVAVADTSINAIFIPIGGGVLRASSTDEGPSSFSGSGVCPGPSDIPCP